MSTFTAQQITDLAEILSTNSDVLGLHLDYYASVITDTDKTAVLGSVTEYQAIESNDVSIEPMEKNFGARIGAGDKRSLIRRRIESLLQWQSVGTGSRLIRA